MAPFELLVIIKDMTVRKVSTSRASTPIAVGNHFGEQLCLYIFVEGFSGRTRRLFQTASFLG